MPRKSKYNLSDPAYAKIPRDIAIRLRQFSEFDDWAELLRDIAVNWIHEREITESRLKEVYAEPEV